MYGSRLYYGYHCEISNFYCSCYCCDKLQNRFPTYNTQGELSLGVLHMAVWVRYTLKPSDRADIRAFNDGLFNRRTDHPECYRVEACIITIIHIYIYNYVMPTVSGRRFTLFLSQRTHVNITISCSSGISKIGSAAAAPSVLYARRDRTDNWCVRIARSMSIIIHHPHARSSAFRFRSRFRRMYTLTTRR